MPPWIRGWSVFTRPPSISGLPVSVSTSSTSRPSSRRPRANSINPRLSETESSARATGRVVASGGVMDASPRTEAGKGEWGGIAEVYRGRTPASNRTAQLALHARSDAYEELVRDRPGVARGLFHRQHRRAALGADVVHRDAARDRAPRAREPHAAAPARRDRNSVGVADRQRRDPRVGG